MALFSTLHHFIALTFLILFLKTQAFDPISPFIFTNFEKDPKFKSGVALYGSEKVINGEYGILLFGYGSFDTGKVICKKPIKLVEGKTRELVSFLTCFTFLISLDDGNGLAFAMVSIGFEGEVIDNSSYRCSLGLKEREFKVIGVEFSASRDGRNGGSAICNVAINVGNSVPAITSNTSSVNMGLSWSI